MPHAEPVLAPPPTKGRASVAQIRDHWYIVCQSKKLKKKPLLRKLLGIPVVLYRDAEGRAQALLDRCAHRNVPLSAGKVVSGNIQCPYHGWEYDGTGACKLVPGLCGEVEHKGRKVPSFPVQESDGFVWVYPTPDCEPTREPYTFPLTDSGYTVVRRVVTAPSSLHAFAENALDVPHTAYLHKGLFRGVSEPNEIKVEITRTSDRVQAEYIGEPRPDGITGRILSPGGGEVIHFDRFILPAVIQVEYRIGDENHILVSAFCTPEEDFFTRIYAIVAFKTRIPGWLLKPVVLPFALRIFKQDVDVLKLQSDTIQQFGGEQYVSTEIDVLGNHIWRLLRQAERQEPSGSSESSEPVVKELMMRV